MHSWSCRGYLKKLKCKYLIIAKGDEFLRIIRSYNGVFQCVQVQSTEHTFQLRLHVNRKSYHSIVMQALAGDKYLFRDIVVGWPGSVHNARVFSNSELYTLGCSSQPCPKDLKKVIIGKEIYPMILGDPAHPLLSWLIKGYPENINTPCIHRRFNYHLSQARMTVENTFGYWKGTFRRFTKHINMDVEGVSCCSLMCYSQHL